MFPEFKFEITHQSTKSNARTGLLHTPHGVVETPTFVPVATRGALRLLDAEESAELGSQLYICNTFHLHLSPGEDVVEKAGGLQGYTHLNKPLFTDSGGFQVYSLGFGSDHSMGKILQTRIDADGTQINADDLRKSIEDGQSAKNVKITEDGATFRSPINGDEMFLSPELSIEIQEKLGADVMFAFDECPSPLSTEKYLRQSVDRTHRWAQRCIEARDAGRLKYGGSTSVHKEGRYGYMQALYGIVQGGAFEDMRVESARTLGAMDFEGYGIGGEFGYDKESLEKMLRLTTSNLPNEKPRHVLGVGHPEDFEYIARGGGDTFDCIAPTHYARRGVVFVREDEGGESGDRKMTRLDLRNKAFLTDMRPLDTQCACPTCTTYTRSFISHLIRSNELTGMKLATAHNIYYFNQLSRELCEKIQRNEL